MGSALVIENSPAWHLGRLEEWLDSAGVRPDVIRPHRGETIPARVSDHDCLVALGGGRGVAWTNELAGLLAHAVADSTPTLAICSSARLLAVEFGGTVSEVEEFRPGPRLLGRRDAAGDDPLFATAPMTIDVVAWRHEELASLPQNALSLAASPQGAPDVFRIGTRAWGIQSHMELDGAMVTELGGDAELAARVDGIGEYLTDTWQPIIARFAGVATGRTAGQPLPLLDN
ncbi:GMP synthase-like glutamine amidotransferase [Stackebrandtia endophytica]|uniref:GMP synthase-like glutamine amidotransferase n=1 Tax=Stackebrandtia endophytica TaxID=1496996 RepID=A0A543ARF0_9ACTN|nr:type 1 glutamine amidotransferase [Stackebrandtia endophytica]TQL75163.1 GMP synthase-like glutamine amidotransferase [Stackebrandtia endophytica]